MVEAGSDVLIQMDVPVKVSTEADFSRLDISVQEGFVLSRIDGSSTVRTICLISGMGERATLEILRRLHRRGLILVGDEKPVKIPQSTQRDQTAESKQNEATGDQAAVEARVEHQDVIDQVLELREIQLPETSESVDLRPDARRRIAAFYQILDELNYFEILGLNPTEDGKEIHRAYFRRSKEFHPDRYFNRELGPYKEMLRAIFERVRNAYRYLGNDEYRRSYLERERQQMRRTPLVWQLKRRPTDGTAGRGAGPTPSRGTPQSNRQAAVTEPADGSQYHIHTKRPRGFRRRPSSGSSPVVRGKGPEDDEEKGPPPEAPAASLLEDPTLVERAQAQAEPPPVSTVDEAPQPHAIQAARPTAEEPLAATITLSRAPAQGPESRSTRRNLHVPIDMVVKLNAASPTDATSHDRRVFERGLQLLEEGNIRGAASNFRMALSFAPGNPEYQRFYTEAVNRVREISAEGFYQRGSIELEAGHPQVARGLFIKASGLSPEPEYLLKAAETSFLLGDLNTARLYGRRAVENQPGMAEAHYLLARIGHDLGHDEEAISELKQALQYEPDFPEANELLKKLTHVAGEPPAGGKGPDGEGNRD